MEVFLKLMPKRSTMRAQTDDMEGHDTYIDERLDVEKAETLEPYLRYLLETQIVSGEMVSIDPLVQSS